MGGTGTVLRVRLGFTPRTAAIPDDEHPGLLRAGPRSAGPYGREAVEHHECLATDLAQGPPDGPDLWSSGIDTVDLAPLDALQAVLRRVAGAGHITEDDASELRTALTGATLRCASGASATVLFIADEGLLMRSSGPNGRSVTRPESTDMNDHGAATSVHADQDVYGTPLSQLMEGRAPELFRHDSPDGHNHEASMMLVNAWIPLQQITQPLVLADPRTIDRRRHQLRYGLATTSFLERDEDMEINDIWTFLHDEDQRWFLRSEMDHTSAYLFNTLSTAHGAGTLPGEDTAERCWLALERAEEAALAADPVALVDALEPVHGDDLPHDAPPALRAAVDAAVAFATSARTDPAAACQAGEAWAGQAGAIRDRFIRRSLELRLVVSVTPSTPSA